MSVDETISTPVVELIQASRLYRDDGNVVYALRDVSLALTKGSFTAIVGRSGCGKSTLLNLAGAIDLPSSGDVQIERRSTRELDDDELSRLRRTRIGFVFQFFNLLPTLTIAENVELPLLLETTRASASSRADTTRRRSELLEMVGLAHKSASFPHQLSGGEMQRAAVARALIHKPTLVVADEPTGNLDSANAEIILRLLKQITSEMKHTVLMATHSKEAADFASRIVSMRDGKILNF
jgi:ABC-type lipoprotein export system ATPase subunit